MQQVGENNLNFENFRIAIEVDSSSIFIVLVIICLKQFCYIDYIHRDPIIVSSSR